MRKLPRRYNIYRILSVVSALAIFTLFAPLLSPANAQVPQFINYQGKLKDASGTPLTGTYDFRMRIYDDPTVGTLLYADEHAGINVRPGGIFNVAIGSGTVMTPPNQQFSSLGFTEPYYLSVEVGQNGVWDGEMTPRVPLATYMYAFNSQQLEGHSAGNGADDVLVLDSNGDINFAGNIITTGNIESGAITVEESEYSAFAVFEDTSNAVSTSIHVGNGTPENIVAAGAGSLYLDEAGNVFVKESGTGNTGWVELATITSVGNIYNTDGTLTGDRVVDADGHSLRFHNNWIDYEIKDDSSAIIADDSNTKSRFDVEPSFFQLYSQDIGSLAQSSIHGDPTGEIILTSNSTGVANDRMRVIMNTDQFDIVTDDTTFRGATYDKDYSANFTDRSLVDKAYVDDAIVAGANNIYNNDGVINENRNVTVANGGGYTLAFSNTDVGLVFDEDVLSGYGQYGNHNSTFEIGSNNVIFNSFDSSDEKHSFLSLDHVNGTRFEVNTDGVMSHETRIDMNSDDIVFSRIDGTTFKGVTYAADYSANFIDRSLVDKAYVDKQLMWEIVNGGERIQPKDNSVRQIFVEENSNSYTQFKVVNNNDTGNVAGAIIELKGSGADFTNNMYIGKYGAAFWIPELQDNGAVLTDKNLVIGTASASNEIHFVAGNSYSDLRPVVVADNEGFRYTSDLSATYVDRTLVDKGYVDAAITNGKQTLQDVVDTSIAKDGYVTADMGAGIIEDDGGLLFVEAHAGKDFDYGAEGFLVFSLAGGMGDAGHAYVSDYRNAGSRKGLEYSADYSADYTDRSLVDKGYVDNAVASGLSNIYTADGTLTGNRMLDGNNHSLRFENLDFFDAVTPDPFNQYGLSISNSRTLLGYGGPNGISRIESTSGDIRMFREKGSDEASLSMSDTQMLFTDSINHRGVVYADDYSANYTDRSLVDKAYVDSLSGTLWDADHDTGVQVEESNDEDKIRFDTVGVQRIIVDDSGHIGLNTENFSHDVLFYGNVSTTVNVLQSNSTMAGMNIDRFSDDVEPARFTMSKARGSESAPTLIQSGDEIIEISGVAYDGSQYISAGGFIVKTDGTPAANSIPTRLTFLTTRAGALGSDEKMVLTSEGELGIGNLDPDSALHVTSVSGQVGEAILTMENSTGDTQVFNVDNNPENYVTGSVGDIAIDNFHGDMYIKHSGDATDTGWLRLAAGGGSLSPWTRSGTDLSPTTAGDDVVLNTGETLSIVDLAQGSIPFIGAGGMVMQDNSNLYWDDTNNRLGIGTDSPGYQLTLAGDGTSNADASLEMAVYADSGQPAGLYLHRARGSDSSPTAITNTLPIGEVMAGGYDGTSMVEYSAGIQMDATEDWSSTAHGTRIFFSTTENGTTGMVNRMVIGDNGNVGIGTDTPDYALQVNGTIAPEVTDSLGLGTSALRWDLYADEIDVNSLTVNSLLNAPRSNTAPASPVAGTIYFNTADNKLKAYDGTSWHDLY